MQIKPTFKPYSFAADLDTSGGGGGSTLTTPPANSNPNPPAPPQTVPPPASISLPDNWRDSLPPDLKDEPSLKVVHDFNGIVKSYINATKAVGANKAVIPSKDASEDELRDFLHHAGLPKDAKEYQVKFPAEGIDQEFAKGFNEEAFKAGVPPKQAQKIVDWFLKRSGEETQKLVEQKNQTVNKWNSDLRNELGQAYDKEMRKAYGFLKEYGSPEVQKLIDQSGLGNHPAFIKMFIKAGGLLSEDKLPQGDGAVTGGITPKEAENKINEVLADLKHPYYNNKDPRHKAAVEEMEVLFQAKNFVPQN